MRFVRPGLSVKSISILAADVVEVVAQDGGVVKFGEQAPVLRNPADVPDLYTSVSVLEPYADLCASFFAGSDEPRRAYYASARVHKHTIHKIRSRERNHSIGLGHLSNLFTDAHAVPIHQLYMMVWAYLADLFCDSDGVPQPAWMGGSVRIFVEDQDVSLTTSEVGRAFVDSPYPVGMSSECVKGFTERGEVGRPSGDTRTAGGEHTLDRT